MRSGVIALAMAVSGCLTAPRNEVGDRQDGAPGAADAAADAGDQGVPVTVSCAELLPGVPFVEDPATGHCYFVGSTIDFYDVAAPDCTGRGAHVIELDGDTEADLVAEQLLLTDASWWIGLQRDVDANGWIWVDGAPLGAYDDWGSPPNGDGDCVELFVDPAGDCVLGCWNDLDCNAHKKAAICELEP